MDYLIKIYWKNTITGSRSSTAYIPPKMVQNMLNHMKGSSRVPTGFKTRDQPYKEIPNEYHQTDPNINFISPDF